MTKQKFVFIYGLIDPRTDLVRYVGKANVPQKRLAQHTSKARNGERSYKAHWIRELISLNLLPTFLILEKCAYEGWQAREIFWIARFKSNKLTNATTGGEGGFILPPEIETKRVESLKRYFRENGSHSIGFKHTDETRQKMAAAKLGKRFVRGPEALENLRRGQAKRRGEVRTEEQRQKIRESLRGFKHTDETKAKMAARMTKYWAEKRLLKMQKQEKRLP
jgi:GIY-YIG catalytic domain/NUMOD3 motif